MTTIAYKDGVMASDSAWVYAGTQTSSASKILRLSSGALLGEAGDNDSRVIRPLLEKILCFAKIPLGKELAATNVDYSALLAFPNGEVAIILIGHDDKRGWYGEAWKATRGCAAVGSGCDLAYGAMSMGASAAQAVAVACKWNIDSRLPVHTEAVQLRVKSKPKKKTSASRG